MDGKLMEMYTMRAKTQCDCIDKLLQLMKIESKYANIINIDIIDLRGDIVDVYEGRTCSVVKELILVKT